MRADSFTAIPAMLFVASLVCCAPVGETNDTRGRCEYGPVQSLGPLVNSPEFDGAPTVSPDETELFFTSERKGFVDLFVSTRPNRETPWTEPVNLGPPIDDPSAGDFSLRLSGDGNTLYFSSTRSGGFGKADNYVAVRESRQHPWGLAANLGSRLNTDAFEAFPTPSPDGAMLYFNRSTTFDSQDSDIWVTTRSGQAGDPSTFSGSPRASSRGEWSEPQRLPAPINSDRAEFSPAFSLDGLTMYFASDRDGSVEVWVSKRAHPSQGWGTPEKLGPEVNVPGSMTLAPFISRDQRSLYVMAARPNEATGKPCTPITCFKRVDLYVAAVNCR
jgi:hypothetical protein